MIFCVMQLSEIFIENLLPIALGSGGGGAVESFVADLAADKSWHAPLRFESSRISSTVSRFPIAPSYSGISRLSITA